MHRLPALMRDLVDKKKPISNESLTAKSDGLASFPSRLLSSETEDECLTVISPLAPSSQEFPTFGTQRKLSRRQEPRIADVALGSWFPSSQPPQELCELAGHPETATRFPGLYIKSRGNMMATFHNSSSTAKSKAHNHI